MTASPFHDPDKSGEERDPVWKLLGRSPMAEPDAWFTVRTLARCRHAGLAAESRGAVLERVWRWALGMGLTVCLALFVATRIHPASAAATNQKNVQEAFEIMASMDPDADSTSTSWQDSSL